MEQEIRKSGMGNRNEMGKLTYVREVWRNGVHSSPEVHVVWEPEDVIAILQKEKK